MTLGAGASSRDFFGFAYGREGDRYVGFHLGRTTSPILDESLLLVEPKAADRFDQVLQGEEASRKAATLSVGGPALNTGSGAPASGVAEPEAGAATPAASGAKKRTFFGMVELNPMQPKPQFGDVVDEVVLLLNRAGVQLTISVEIHAESDSGFDEAIQRAVRENCNQLKFKHGSFED
jgi:hypothetical protein